jgi:hypothetical protein
MAARFSPVASMNKIGRETVMRQGKVSRIGAEWPYILILLYVTP